MNNLCAQIMTLYMYTNQRSILNPNLTELTVLLLLTKGFKVFSKAHPSFFAMGKQAGFTDCLPEAGDIVTLPMKSVSLVVAYSSKLFQKMFHAPALPRCFR